MKRAARSTTRKKPVHKTKSATVAKKQEHAATNETEDHNADSTQGFDTQDLTGFLNTRLQAHSEAKRNCRNWAAVFEKKVKAQERILREQVKHSEQKLESEKATFKSAVLPILVACLQIAPDEADDTGTAVQSSKPPKLPIIIPREEPKIGQQSLALINRCKTLLEAYERLKDSSPINEIPDIQDMRTTHEKNTSTALAAVKAGKEVAMADIKALFEDSLGEIRGQSRKRSEFEQMGRQLLEAGEDSTADTQESMMQHQPSFSEVSHVLLKAMGKMESLKR